MRKQSLGPYSNVVMNIPIFICLAWLICHFAYLIIRALYNYFKGIQETVVSSQSYNIDQKYSLTVPLIVNHQYYAIIKCCN